ncbi:MAG: outer membrane protein assembly factor BamE [bacterium]|nr:outer membrane protein assembly factor BamE [bacterium]
MTRIAVIGMALIVLASAGCMDKQEITSLKNTDASLSGEIAFLNTRVKAVEEACLQLHGRLNTMENRIREIDKEKTQSQSSIFTPGGAGAKGTENSSSSSGSDTSYKLTRATVGQNLVGMTPEKITKLFGKPDKVTETEGNQSWFYNRINLTKNDGTPEASPALVVFDQGRVSRSILTEEVQYSSEPTEGTASNAVVQTSNAVIQTKQ